MVLSMKEAGRVIYGKGMEFSIGLMEHAMKEIGIIIRQMERGSLRMLTVMSMRGIGSMIKLQASEPIIIIMELSIKGNG